MVEKLQLKDELSTDAMNFFSGRSAGGGYGGVAFFRDLDTLNMRKAHDYPRATETIGEMIAMIETLIANGSAYVAGDGAVVVPDEGADAQTRWPRRWRRQNW